MNEALAATLTELVYPIYRVSILSNGAASGPLRWGWWWEAHPVSWRNAKSWNPKFGSGPSALLTSYSKPSPAIVTKASHLDKFSSLTSSQAWLCFSREKDKEPV